MINQITQGTLTPTNFIKSTLLVKQDTPKILVAATDIQALTTQTSVDQAIINSSTLSPEQCAQTTFTPEELSGGLSKAPVGNEDVGRYVGYGRKEISKGGGLNLGYGLLRLFTLKDNVCYGTNHDAKLLCNNAQAIEAFDVPTLTSLFAQVKPESQAYQILS